MALSKRLLIYLNSIRLSSFYGVSRTYQPQIQQQLMISNKSLPSTASRAYAVSSLPNVQQNGDFFYVPLEGYHRASIKYKLVNGVMVIEHTLVPSVGKGSGVAKLLAKAALDHGEQSGCMVKVECSYVKHFIEKYAPEYKKLLVDS